LAYCLIYLFGRAVLPARQTGILTINNIIIASSSVLAKYNTNEQEYLHNGFTTVGALLRGLGIGVVDSNEERQWGQSRSWPLRARRLRSRWESSKLTLGLSSYISDEIALTLCCMLGL